jgi:DNA-binding response OmpR family regulator
MVSLRPVAGRGAVISMNKERARANVLLVEDEAWIRELWTEELEDEDAGYSVIPVATARAALPLLRSGSLLAAAVIDIGLPEMSGEALIQLARSIDPLTPIVAVTGFDAADYRHLSEQGIPVLQKPFRTSWLLFHLRASLLARRIEPRCRDGRLVCRAIC